MSIFKRTLLFAPIQLISWMFVQWIVLQKLFEYETPYDALLYRSFFIYILFFLVIYLLGSFLGVFSTKNVIIDKYLFNPRILLLYSIAIFIFSFFVFDARSEWTWSLFFFYFVSPYFLFLLIGSYVVTCILLFLGISCGEFLAKVVKQES